jgi:heme-degrading monooxygenase HmoA
MIARLWRGLTRLENAAAYEEHLAGTVFPALDGIAGHMGAYLLRREVEGDAEFVVLTLWASGDAIREFTGEDTDVAVVEPKARDVLVEYDRRVRHFEVLRAPESR